MIHGGTITTTAFSWAGLVIGGYCSLEVFRLKSEAVVKIPAAVLCCLYGLAVGAGLYFAAPYIPRLFAT